jgi:hypothetical protein
MKVSIFILTSFLVTACSQPSKESKKPINLLDFDWLQGQWINNEDSNAIFYENWSKISSKKLTANSFILKSQDTIFFETIILEIHDTATFYKVSVKNQNNAEAVNFKLVSNDYQSFIFENKLHDFPQRIIYQYKAPDTLHAWIEGIVKGELRKETFLMWRKH